MRLSYDTAVSSMRLIKELGFKGYLDSVGIGESDFRKFVGEEPWLPTDRSRMTSVLSSIISSSMDFLGLPRFDMPAEYIAAGIAVFIAPVNIHAACIYAPAVRNAEDIAEKVNSDTCKPDQVFALVSQLYASSERTQARASFEKKCSVSLDKMLKKA